MHSSVLFVHGPPQEVPHGGPCTTPISTSTLLHQPPPTSNLIQRQHQPSFSLNLLQCQPPTSSSSNINHLITTVQLLLVPSEMTIFCLLHRVLYPRGPIQSFLESAISHPCPPVAYPDFLPGSLGFPTIIPDNCSPRSQDPLTTRSSCISG